MTFSDNLSLLKAAKGETPYSELNEHLQKKKKLYDALLLFLSLYFRVVNSEGVLIARE